MEIAGEGAFQRIPVDELELDSRNPRVARVIEMYGDSVTPEQMGLALGAGGDASTGNGTTFHSLRESIRTSRGIIHPITVNSTKGKSVVIEGNTRTLIYREFRDRGYEGNWSTIPAIVYEDLSPQAIDGIRLQSHLVGPRDWEPYSKAKYLDYLRNSEHLPMSQVIDFCGGRKSEVLEYIGAYQDMETYYRPILDSDDQFDPQRFSSFAELQKARIQTTLLETKHTKADFASWVKDELISPQNLVRQLPMILRDPEAKMVFLNEGAREAVKVLDRPSPDEALNHATLEELARELTKRILTMQYRELRRLQEDLTSDANEVLVQARDTITELCADIASDG